MDQERVDHSEMGARDGKGWMGGGTVESFWTSNDRPIGQTAFVPVISPIPHFTRPPRKLLPPSVSGVRVLSSEHQNTKSHHHVFRFRYRFFFFWENSVVWLVVCVHSLDGIGIEKKNREKKQNVNV